MVDEDLYRWCVYCNVDCWVDSEYQEHAADCPETTGVFPVAARDIKPCPHCGEVDVDMACASCGTPFELGDSYMHQQLPHDTDDVRQVVCVGCGVLSTTAEWDE